ncbi:metallophosphoesterase [Synechococcus sp. 1G10]|uniref:metallophosphoesterase family protein n=1 Tax=Synechococcus sp. 1G10 TaxID=2025605 RepID=UPI000B9843FC|nr:metallophosphoesterase [Synechococcus sp. 1G10]
MNLASEAGVATKICRMGARVRWGHPEFARLGIDPCRLALEGDPGTAEAFSFLVLGDSGSGRRRRHSPQRKVAEQLLAHGADASFLLHTGDVVYLVGSSEQYPENFIRPYREWIEGGDDWRGLRYDQLLFRVPFLPVLGNHDYYDLPFPLGLLSGLTALPRRLLGSWIDSDVGWHGSFVGQAWANAFIDVLAAVPEAQLAGHLERTRSATVQGRRCLLYRPGAFTRLPHRYYAARWAGVDVFALDSNTFNEPLSPQASAEVDDPALLQSRRHDLAARRSSLLRSLADPWSADDDDDLLDDRLAEAEQLEEDIRDIDKRLASGAAARAGQSPALDQEQLDWFVEALVSSWHDPAVRGRLLVLHHPPVVTEASKWNQGQTLAVRHHLRIALDRVAAALGEQHGGRPLLDLAIAGHAHCLEVLRVGPTGHGDAGIPWLICGGSGYSLRRQRPEGPVLREGPPSAVRELARSSLFLGRSGHGSALCRSYSAVRVDVEAGTPFRLSVTPLVAERTQGRWRSHRLPSFAP